MSPRKLAVMAIVAAFSPWTPASSAFAQATPAPGVHVDPDSPAGREYAIPLEATRRDFGNERSRPRRQARTTPREQSGSSSSPSREIPPPRFGAGITPEAKRPAKRSQPREVPRRRATPKVNATGGVTPAAADTDSGVSSTALSAGIVAAVLLGALALLAVLRWRRAQG